MKKKLNIAAPWKFDICLWRKCEEINHAQQSHFPGKQINSKNHGKIWAIVLIKFPKTKCKFKRKHNSINN